MDYEDMKVNKIEEMNLISYTITLPRNEVMDVVGDAVIELIDSGYDRETIEMVRLLGHLTALYGNYYGEQLLDLLVGSMQATNGFDDNDAQRFRQALEAAILEHHDNAGVLAA